MFHLEYNNQRGFFTWEEIRCLCRSLGFQPDTVWLNLPADIERDSSGLLIKEFQRLIALKHLDLAVDETFNPHTADWNLCVFKKAILLVDHRVLSFQELHDIRMVYSMYEHQDLKGLEMCEKTLLRCLKMCGRIIAPLKMQHRLKHMSQAFDEEGRIQLYEFLDLILWTDMSGDHRPVQTTVTNKRVKGDSYYKIEDFQHIVKHYDERLAEYLNDIYMDEEWSFGKESFSKQKLPNELPVNRDFRLGPMRQGKNNYKHLKNEVGVSQNSVHLTATGHIRPRPLTAPNIDRYDGIDKASIYTAHSQHPMTVSELVKDYITPPHTTYSAITRSKTREFESRPHTCKSAVKQAVTDEDLAQTEHDMQDLRFLMSTVHLPPSEQEMDESEASENKYEVRLEKRLKDELPRFTRKVPEIVVVPEVVEPPAANPALTLDHINRLAYAPYRPAPSPRHARSCDARFRGWHKTKTTKGQHFVLTTDTFASGAASKDLKKINKRFNKEVRSVKGDCIIRRTTDKNVRPEILRPATAPELKLRLKATERQAVSINAPSDDEEMLTTNTPSPTRARYDAKLETIREGRESRVQSSGSRVLSGTVGARDSVTSATSSARTYSFHDFNQFDDYIDKSHPNADDRSAARLVDDAPKFTTSEATKAKSAPTKSSIRPAIRSAASRSPISRGLNIRASGHDDVGPKSSAERMLDIVSRRDLPKNFKKHFSSMIQSEGRPVTHSAS